MSSASEAKRRALELIGGRERIMPDEAAHALGRWGAPALADYRIEPGEDGLVSAAEVLRVLDRQKANRRKRAAQARPGRVASVLTRWQDEAEWDMELPPVPGVLGSVRVVAYSAEPLAAPAPVLAVWVADWEIDDEGWARVAVSARAAQVILARHKAPQAILPSWASEVRELTDEHAGEIQRIAEAKAAGRTVESDVLTPWEVAQIEPVENPRHRMWRSALALGGDADEVLTAPAQGRVPTPASVVFGMESSLNGERWSLGTAAAELGVSIGTVRGHIADGIFPTPDGHGEDGHPWWLPATIRSWREFRGLSLADAAALAGLSPAAFRSAMSRADESTRAGLAAPASQPGRPRYRREAVIEWRNSRPGKGNRTSR